MWRWTDRLSGSSVANIQVTLALGLPTPVLATHNPNFFPVLHQLPHSVRVNLPMDPRSQQIYTFQNPAIFPNDAPDSDTTASIILQLDRQIQSELEQAAERGMVSTRSQDNTPAARLSQPSTLLNPQVVVQEKKRKVDDDDGGDPLATAVTKRRRGSADSNGDAAPSFVAGEPGRPRQSISTTEAGGDAADVGHHNGSDQESSTQGSHPTSSHTSRITTESTLDNEKNDSLTEVATNNEPKSDVLDAQDQVKLDTGGTTESRRGRTPKKGRKDSERVAHVDENDMDSGINGNDAETAFPKAAKATHKRFGSEDVEVPKTVPSIGIEERREGREDLLEDGDESEDEAPETVTVSAGFDESRKTVLGAAKLAAR